MRTVKYPPPTPPPRDVPLTPSFETAKRASAVITVSVDCYPVTALVDTGADYSVMCASLANRLRKVLTAWDGPHLVTAGGHLVSPIGRCTARLTIYTSTFVASFLVLPKCSRLVILGMDFLQEYGAIINLRDLFVTFSNNVSSDSDVKDEHHRAALRVVDDCVTLPPRSSIFVLVECPQDHLDMGIAEGNLTILLDREVGVARGLVELQNRQTTILVTNFSGEYKHFAKHTTIAYFETVDESNACASVTTISMQENSDVDLTSHINVNPQLKQPQQERLLSLLSSFNDCFATTSKVKQTPLTKHRIITEPTVQPVRQHAYRVSQREQDAIRHQVKQMLDDDVIQPSTSPWASPVVLVKKKDGSLRFCVDYRKLNKITKKDVYPLPRIDDSLDRLRHARYFSSMDLRSGYWQIEVDERDREKTAFITPDGLYEFKVLPFGLCSAPATFQRMMDTVLSDLKWHSCLVYLDDVVVFSTTFEQHIERLEAVLQAIRTAGLSLKPEKCHFGYEELKFLGHIVSNTGIRPDPDKATAVRLFPIPKTKHDVRRFLGLCAYYRRFVPNFSEIAEPLQRLIKNDVTFIWGPAQSDAFHDLQRRLQTPPILGHFDTEADTEVHTDASNVGLGATLVQFQAGVERVIAYASRTLSAAEKNYSATEKECLAVVWAIQKFRPYLYGRAFRVVSDHHSLCWLANLKDPSGRLARWSLRLQEFDMTIVYKSGQKHTDADCLSRAPVEPAPTDTDEDCGFLCSLPSPNLAQQQRQDSELQPLIEYLERRRQQPPRQFARHVSSFCLRSDILYKRNFHPTETVFLLVVPASLRDDILRACHDEPTSGHLGFTRTLARIKKKYYWRKLTKSVKQYVRTCRDCQRRKVPPMKPAGLLQPVRPPCSPFEQVGMDLLGPFPKSSADNRWIVVATDYLTRYCETQAVQRATASDVANFFVKNIVLRHGAPSVVITDRGTAFTAQLVRDILQLSGTTHRTATAYHPQTNGLTERLNKTIADMLSMYVATDHKNWDELLPYVTFAYNTALQETTGFPPFRLVYGRDVVTMLDVMLLPTSSDTTAPDTDAFVQRAEAARHLARQRILSRQSQDARRYNIRHRVVTYKPGDLVWIWTPIRLRGRSEKLLRRYFGPYIVLHRISQVNYEVVPAESSHQSRRPRSSDIVHVSRMKPYHSR